MDEKISYIKSLDLRVHRGSLSIPCSHRYTRKEEDFEKIVDCIIQLDCKFSRMNQELSNTTLDSSGHKLCEYEVGVTVYCSDYFIGDQERINKFFGEPIMRHDYGHTILNITMANRKAFEILKQLVINNKVSRLFLGLELEFDDSSVDTSPNPRYTTNGTEGVIAKLNRNIDNWTGSIGAKVLKADFYYK